MDAEKTNNYQGYLQSVFPNTTWTIEPIPDGFINTTLRAIETSGTGPYRSLILKHARPTFGSPTKPKHFSIKRQEIEATILKLWNSEDTEMYNRSEAEKFWRIPQHIHNNSGTESSLGLSDRQTEASVLFIQDLGQLERITTCLENWAKMPASPQLDGQILQAGSRLGHSLAQLHSKDTVETIQKSPEMVEILSQSLTDHLVWAVTVDALPEYLTSLPDAKELHRRLEEDLKTPKYHYPNVLGHSDFHDGNVLMPLNPKPEDSIVPVVVDWEFGHLNARGVNGDAAEMLGGLHCKLITARNSDHSALTNMYRQFLTGFCSGYRERAQLRCSYKDQDTSNLQLLRSAFLFNAAELLSCANEYDTDSKGFDEMVNVGVWYLRTAGKDVDEFRQEANWQEVLKEDEGLLTSLFILDG